MSLRVALVGAGYFAQFHLAAWRELGVELVGVCDLDADRARALGERFGAHEVFGDAARMLDALKPDLLDIAAPPNAHHVLVNIALQRRVPAICQKPFGADLAQATEMAKQADTLGVPLVVHENFRFTPWFQECRRLLDQGVLGTPHGIAFRLRPGDGQGTSAYLDRQPYFQQMPQLLIRETGVHFIDSFRFLLGEVTAVTARLRRLNPVIAGEDAGLVIFEFASGASGLFDGNRLNDHAAQNPRRTMGEMWIEGSAGVLRLDGDARLWFKPHQGAEAEHIYDRGDDGAFGGACRRLQAHVLQHLQSGTPLQNAATDYLHNLRVQAAVYHSHATGTRVEMDRFDPHPPQSRRQA